MPEIITLYACKIGFHARIWAQWSNIRRDSAYKWADRTEYLFSDALRAYLCAHILKAKAPQALHIAVHLLGPQDLDLSNSL